MEMFDALFHLVSTDVVQVEGASLAADVEEATLGTGAAEPVVLGNKWKTYFSNFLNSWAATHVHPTGVGPSGPPAAAPPPFDEASLSQAIKAK
jgi:hypothetical protein